MACRTDTFSASEHHFSRAAPLTKAGPAIIAGTQDGGPQHQLSSELVFRPALFTRGIIFTRTPTPSRSSIIAASAVKQHKKNKNSDKQPELNHQQTVKAAAVLFVRFGSSSFERQQQQYARSGRKHSADDGGRERERQASTRCALIAKLGSTCSTAREASSATVCLLRDDGRSTRRGDQTRRASRGDGSWCSA